MTLIDVMVEILLWYLAKIISFSESFDFVPGCPYSKASDRQIWSDLGLWQEPIPPTEGAEWIQASRGLSSRATISKECRVP